MNNDRNQALALRLSSALDIMDDKAATLVFLAGQTDRTAHKHPIEAATADRQYGDLIVSHIWPYISEDGEYRGNVYVCPEFNTNKAEGEYLTNPNPHPVNIFAWRPGDEAWVIDMAGIPKHVFIRGIQKANTPKATIVFDNGLYTEIDPDMLFQDANFAVDTWHVHTAAATMDDNADDNLNEYDVTISRLGSIHIQATSREDAIAKAEKVPENAIKWFDYTVTDAEKCEFE